MILPIGFLVVFIVFSVLCNQIQNHRCQIHYLTICPAYEILSRQGLDICWRKLGRRYSNLSVVFLDVDFMHEANERWGYSGVDSRIRNSFKQLRSGETIGRWYSGDEAAILVPNSEAQAAADRIAQAFRENDLSVTIGIARCTSIDLAANVKAAADLVQAAKREGRRGSIGGWAS